MSLLRTDVLQVVPAGSRWTVLGRGRKAIACFGTEEEAVAYAGFLARGRPVERLQIIDFDGSIALEEWLSRPEEKTARR